jgi:hypothetical protein
LYAYGVHTQRVNYRNGVHDIHKPIGISEYRLAGRLPEKLHLPSIEELENELGAASGEEAQTDQ